MRKKRSAGSLLDVLKAQHFDSGISLTRRVAIKLARYFQTGSTNYDPQIVDGTIGNLVGAFLMQLVASPTDRPEYGHLWGLGGVPATYNGDGTATPIFDAWGNQDIDIEPLTVDIGTQSLSNGDPGAIFRGTEDDAQDLVFLGNGGGGGGGGGDFGDFSDGDFHLDGVATTFGQAYATSGPKSYAIYYDSVNTRPTVYFMQRDLYCDTLTIDAGITLMTNGFKIYARKLVGGGTISANPCTYMNGTNWVDAVNPGFGTFVGRCFYANFGGAGNLGNGSVGSGALYAARLYRPTPTASGNGGKGGNCGANTGGNGGTSAAKGDGNGALTFSRSDIYEYAGGLGGSITTNACASGGGGGAGDGTHLGGNGGCGGEFIVLRVADLSGFTGTLDASGSPGEPGNGSIGYDTIGGYAAHGTGGGGGGGGGGGFVWIVTVTDGSYTVNVGGGAAGAAGAFGLVGVAGSAGFSFKRLVQ